MGHFPGPRNDIRRGAGFHWSWLGTSARPWVLPTGAGCHAGEGNPSQVPWTEDYKVWIKGMGHLVDMPAWWWELIGMLGITNFWELSQKIRASFELPLVRSEAQDVENDYLAPLASKCIWGKDFLWTPNPIFPCQDIREGAIPKNFGLCPSPAVLGREVQPTYTWPTTTFGRMHAGTETGNGVIHYLLRQCCPRGCHPLRKVPGRTNQGNYSQKDPASLHQCSC